MRFSTALFTALVFISNTTYAQVTPAPKAAPKPAVTKAKPASSSAKAPIAQSKPTVLFEGYSKIMSAGVHVGYTVGRYEFDPATKRFKATTFIRTGQLGADIMESLKAECDEKFGPIRYEYTSIMGKQIKTIDAKFNRVTSPAVKGKPGKIKLQMVAVVKEGNNSRTIRKDLEDGTFLSGFLVYLMLQSKQGIQTNANYQYKAIAEEDAEVHNGEARVDKQEKFNGVDTFKINNTFKNVTFAAYVTDRGEVMATKSPAVSIATELVGKSSDAVGALGLASGVLKSLFGEVPTGMENVVSRTMIAESKPVVIPSDPKKDGVPGGQGIILKSQGASGDPSAAPKEVQ
ncbi:MAG: hypothetical protein V4736_11340 [Bdellovibrionota bacterium]